MNDEVNNTNENLPRREREKLAHRKEILDAAMRIFEKKGFFAATIDEIAQEAEFSKGALYLYFSSKEDMLYSLLMEKISGFYNAYKSSITGESSFRDELQNLYYQFSELAFKDRVFFSLLMGLNATGFRGLSKESACDMYDIHKQFDTVVVARAVKAIDDGELRDVSPEAVHGIIHGAMENLLVTRWGFETVEELQIAVDSFLDVLFNGIALKKEISE